MNQIRDKNKGMFYGLAIGDALGAAVEFRERGSFEPVTGYRGFGPHGLAPGQWTDDTSMALALADSLAKGWDAKDQLQNYLAWFQSGKYSVTGYLFDIGTTTRTALGDFELTGSLVNNVDKADSGNGSIMRLAPIPIVYGDEPVEPLAETARASSVTTHGSQFCTDCCAYLAVILAKLARGGGKEILTKEWWDANGVPLHTVVTDWIFDKNCEPEGRGFVIPSLHAALWAFREGSTFEDAVLKAVNLGDDSDTTGAICGQLAGAHWGFSQIPASLVEGLAKKEMIDQYLDPILK